MYYAAIMVASENHRARQLEMARFMTVEIATALILRGERNLDMLQGLIIHNAWSVAFCCKKSLKTQGGEFGVLRGTYSEINT